MSIPLPAVTVYPGDIVTRELLTERTVRARRSLKQSYFSSQENLVGKVAVRVLPAGKAIPLNAVREPYIVKKGELVTLRFGRANLSIMGLGLALQPGLEGDVISLKNPDTEVVIRGVVRADGSVDIAGANQ